jgi:hypothetical protein
MWSWLRSRYLDQWKGTENSEKDHLNYAWLIFTKVQWKKDGSHSIHISKRQGRRKERRKGGSRKLCTILRHSTLCCFYPAQMPVSVLEGRDLERHWASSCNHSWEQSGQYPFSGICVQFIREESHCQYESPAQRLLTKSQLGKGLYVRFSFFTWRNVRHLDSNSLVWLVPTALQLNKMCNFISIFIWE